MQKLLILLERDVGLFSLFHQVINALAAVEEDNLSYVPIPIFGQGCLYFSAQGHHGKKNVWEYYFEPLVEGFGEELILQQLGQAPMDKLETMRRACELNRGAREFPDQLYKLKPLNFQDQRILANLRQATVLQDYIWTDDFAPSLPDRVSPPVSDKINARLVSKYIRFRPYVRDKIDSFYDQHLAGHHIIGIHIRGTDGLRAPARGVEIVPDRFFREIDTVLTERGRNNCRILVASDEEKYVTFFRTRYPDLVTCYPCIRASESDPVFGKGPAGQVMPGYLSQNPSRATQNGEDVVVEYGLLSRSDFFLFNGSSVASAVTYSVENSISIS
jgi:hypothetical protein